MKLFGYFSLALLCSGGWCLADSKADASATPDSDAATDAQYTNLLASTVNAYATAEGLINSGLADGGAGGVQVVGPADGPAVVPSVTSSQFHAQDEIGQYSYGYENPTSKKVETKTADGVVEGFYSYLSPDGQVITNEYRADALGFQSSLAPSNANDPIVIPDPVYVESGGAYRGDAPEPAYQADPAYQSEPAYKPEPAYLDSVAVVSQPQPVLKGYVAVPEGHLALQPQPIPLPAGPVRVEQRPNGIIEHQSFDQHSPQVQLPLHPGLVQDAAPALVAAEEYPPVQHHEEHHHEEVLDHTGHHQVDHLDHVELPHPDHPVVTNHKPHQPFIPPPVVKEYHPISSQPVVKPLHPINPPPVVKPHHAFQAHPVVKSHHSIPAHKVVKLHHTAKARPVVKLHHTIKAHPVVKHHHTASAHPVPYHHKKHHTLKTTPYKKSYSSKTYTNGHYSPYQNKGYKSYRGYKSKGYSGYKGYNSKAYSPRKSFYSSSGSKYGHGFKGHSGINYNRGGGGYRGYRRSFG